MNKNTSVSLDEQSADFVETQISDGRYRSAEEVVRAGLRLLEQQDGRLAALRAALVEGERSGVAADFDFDSFWARMHDAA